ncbi:50S ribosomal protein L4 [Candidatus Woesearchaeota archaeon]|nr:50S ribosomal protein L4 [Candidatus Woesearchaeota archaeon]
MKVPLYTAQKQKKNDVELPHQFHEAYRPDLIRRAVHVLQSAGRQLIGASSEAGFRHSSRVSKRRRDYRGCYGFGISRVNRKILSRRGTRMFWVGAFSPQTVGGRRAHPPKVMKVLEKLLNTKENQKAIRSAMAATVDKHLVSQRGHHIPSEYPFIIDSSFEKMQKTQEVVDALSKLGFEAELKRSSVKKIRAGHGTMRNRRYKRKKGILVVTSGDCPLMNAARNLAGVDVAKAESLNAELLAPGALPGRVTLWTEGAIDAIKSKKLFA